MNVKKKRLLRQIDADDDKLIEFEIYKKKISSNRNIERRSAQNSNEIKIKINNTKLNTL